jgi:hypothetical protein
MHLVSSKSGSRFATRRVGTPTGNDFAMTLVGWNLSGRVALFVTVVTWASISRARTGAEIRPPLSWTAWQVPYLFHSLCHIFTLNICPFFLLLGFCHQIFNSGDYIAGDNHWVSASY